MTRPGYARIDGVGNVIGAMRADDPGAKSLMSLALRHRAHAGNYDGRRHPAAPGGGRELHRSGRRLPFQSM